MSLDLARILESKRTHRTKLAALPIAEKLRLLDAMRERSRSIRSSSRPTVREDPPSYGSRS